MRNREEAPRATIALSEALEGIDVDFPGGARSLTLDPARSLRVRLAAMATAWVGDYVVRVCTFGPDGRHDPARLRVLHERGWGGLCNHIVRFDTANGWVVEHSQHALPILVNGEEMHGHSRSFFDGDRIEPARGLVFRF